MKYIGDYLRQNASEYPERIAVIQDERSLTYRELDEECNRLANALNKLGLSRGDQLAVLMKSSIEWLMILYACQKLGIGVTLVHSRLLPEEIQRTVELADARTLVYSQDFIDKACYISTHSTSIKQYAFFGNDKNVTPLPMHCDLNQMLQEQSAEESQVPLDGSEACVILFTSGTTSASKGIKRTQQMMGIYASILEDPASKKKQDLMLTPSPLYHAAGLCCVIKMLVNAGTLILLSRFDAEKICRQIQAFQATQIALVPPTTYQRLKASEFAAQYDLSSIELAHIAAGKASKECLQDLFSMFPKAKLRLSWGSTEASNVTSVILNRKQLDEHPKLKSTIGKINSVSEIKLVASDGSPVEGEGDGEAWVRSPLVFSGYIKAPELTENSFQNGWYKTEDILHRDADGYYYLRDRKRDMIKTGGENVYAQEIEQAILENPSIAECAVIGIPDPKYGEAVAAALVLKEGRELSADDFILFCRRVLPSFKKPKYWAVIEALPKNDIGKVRKSVLKAHSAELFTTIA